MTDDTDDTLDDILNEILRIELIDILEQKLMSQPIILLGDSSHGDTSSELLAERYANTGYIVDTLFMEGVPHSNGINWASAPLNILKTAEKIRVESARVFASNIYGLETSETDPDLPVADKLEFAENYRNTVCFPVWREIIDEHMDFEGGLNVAVVGAAHLSTVREKNGIIPPLQSAFNSPDGASAFAVAMIDESIEIDKIEDYGPIEKTKYYAAHGLHYIPHDGSTSIPMILNPWPEPDSETDVIASLL